MRRAVLGGKDLIGWEHWWCSWLILNQIHPAGSANGARVDRHGQSSGRINTHIQDILVEPESLEHAHMKPPIHGNLEFRNVSFTRYEPGKPVLQDISFRIQPEADSGSFGADRIRENRACASGAACGCQQGSIILDGVELKEIDKPWLRRHVGLVLGAVPCFSKTVKEKYLLARNGAQDAEILTRPGWPRCMVILQFEQGYETAVGRRNPFGWAKTAYGDCAYVDPEELSDSDF